MKSAATAGRPPLPRANTDQTPNGPATSRWLPEIETHLDRLLGDVKGYVHLRSQRGSSGSDHTFDWPDRRAEVIQSIASLDGEGFDVYLCPNVLKGTARRANTSVARTKIHADIDHGDPSVLKFLKSIGAYVVSSGSAGHLHAYVFLDRSIDHAKFEKLIRALRARVNGDTKIRDNDLLRVPGTHNWKKPADPSPVLDVTKWGIVQWDPDLLATHLGADRTPASAVINAPHIPSHADKCVPDTRPPLSRLKPFFAQMIQTGQGLERYASRSEARQAISTHAVNRGLSRDELSEILLDPENESHKWYKRRPEEQINRDWATAQKFVANNPAIQSKADVLAIIDQKIGEAASRPWPGRGGQSEELIYREVLNKALSLGALQLDMSVRELAELSGLHYRTAARALKRLQERGLLQRVSQPWAPVTHAAALRIPIGLPNQGTIQRVPIGVSPHDYWTARRTSRMVYEAVDAQPGTDQELAVRTGKVLETVRKHCKILESDQLIEQDDEGQWTVMHPNPEGLRMALDNLAQEYGSAGTLKRREEQHEAQREAYRLFTGRKGYK